MAGVSPRFSPLDLMRALLLLSVKPMSRVDVVKILGLGEGSVRSILGELKAKGWAGSTRQGHVVSIIGLVLQKKICSHVFGPVEVFCRVFSYPYCAGVLVKLPPQGVDMIKLRDSALKWGAEAALVLMMKENTLAAPQIESHLDVDCILKSLKPKEGNLVIVTFAQSMRAAKTSALAGAVAADPWLKGWLENHIRCKAQGILLP